MSFYARQKHKGAPRYVWVDANKNALMTECRITHIKTIRALTTVCASMSNKIALKTKCLLTQVTSIMALPTMCVIMTYKTAFWQKALVHITSIMLLITMYIIRMPACSTVCMKRFIWSTLVNTQRLNIRIYSDRKNYFYSNVYIK